MTPSTYASDEIRKTKEQYLEILRGSYFVAGFFWVFSTVGSMYLPGTKDSLALFASMIALMVSNGVWEILTGWYADKFRRRFSISAGFFAYGLGFLIMLVAVLVPFDKDAQATVQLLEPRLVTWLVGVTVWSLGPALLSGAQEAWLVDRCNFLSATPPEPLNDVFKTAAKHGVISKAAGCLICFFVLVGLGSPTNRLGLVLTAGVAALSSFSLFVYSLRLQEEYWTDPKYQTEESLFAFWWMGIKDLWKVPYRWFTVAFIGATSLNYALSFTVWPYLAQLDHKDVQFILGGNTGPKLIVEDRDIGFQLVIAGGIIGLELVAGFVSGAFSRRIDLIRQPRWRMPAASLMYLVPVVPLYLSFLLVSSHSTGKFLCVLIAASFFFRIAHASVFGTLNGAGQLAIESDERRAVLVSMSSALAAFFVAALLRFCYSDEIRQGIPAFWVAIILPSILMLAVGGYLVARGGRS
jgi:MFS family permease